MTTPLIIDTTICGIPAQVRVTHYLSLPGNFSSMAETPDEYYGARELDFDVLDRRGRDAPWLERKMHATKGEFDRVERAVFAQIEADRADSRADDKYQEYLDRQMEDCRNDDLGDYQ